MTTIPDPPPPAAGDGGVEAEPDLAPDAAPGLPMDPAVDGPADAAVGIRRYRGILLVLAVLRYVIPIAALPLLAVWIPERMVALTLVRPGKEVLLAAGGVYRTNADGQPDLLLLFLAYLPLMVGGVWVFFALGRAWQAELARGQGPAWLERVVPPEVLSQMQRLLEARGPMLAFLGRIAALPPTIMAAAAGTSRVDTRAYLAADFLGAITSFAVTVYAGWWLGEAYERGGIWLTVGGIALLVAIVAWATSWLRREPDTPEGDDDHPARRPEVEPGQ